MASLKEHSTTNNKMHIQPYQHRLPLSTAIPVKVQQSSILTESTTTKTIASLLMIRLIGILFLMHLILITGLVIFVTVQGLRSDHFHATKWYPPLLTSTACAAVLSLVWQWLADLSTSKAFKAAFWLSPLFTCAVSLLLLTIGSSISLAVGITALLCSIVLSLYGCWVSPRFEYAIRVLKISSVDFHPPKATSLIVLSMLVSFLYCGLLVTGIGGATAGRDKFEALFITMFLLSLTWTMQVIRNTMLASITRVKYMYLLYGIDIDARVALGDTIRHLMGSVSIGSLLVPVLGIIWGSARAMRLVAGDTDEFLFSCVDCYARVATTLVIYGNRWGFVYVGVYNKGFVQASIDVWNMFRRSELESLIDSDLTGSFCFLSGVAVGAICSLVSGSWALAVHKSYATELSLYAFFIGYVMSRIAMAWQQACVTAYYVAFAENTQNPRFDSTIPARIQELQRVQA